MSPAKLPITLVLIAALAFAGGCSEDGPVTLPGPGEVHELSADYTDPAAAVHAVAAAHTQKNLDVYAALLHEDFEYFPLAADEFPWLPSSGWDSAIELGIVANMFDPSFISQDTGENVDTIEMSFIVRGQRPIGDFPNAIEVTAEMNATVLWAQGDGATSDVRMVLTLVPDEDGYYRVIRQVETYPVLLVEAQSWSLVKALYR